MKLYGLVDKKLCRSTITKYKKFSDKMCKKTVVFQNEQNVGILVYCLTHFFTSFKVFGATKIILIVL